MVTNVLHDRNSSTTNVPVCSAFSDREKSFVLGRRLHKLLLKLLKRIKMYYITYIVVEFCS